MTLKVTADGSRTLYSERYQQNYHSHFGAETESRYVFLETSGVAERLKAGRQTSILELGFGLGLNYLLTADKALTSRAPLSYTAIENDLISAEDLSSLRYDNLLTHGGLITSLSTKLGHPGVSPLELHEGTVTLSIKLANIEDVDYREGAYDAIYLDAFSPDANPECWTAEIFRKLARALRTGGVLATYCVKGSVRRGLQDAGFTTTRLPGPPGKREILRATQNLGNTQSH